VISKIVGTGAMSRSEQLWARDVCAVRNLVEQCGELWADPDAWQEHLLTELRRMTGAKSCVYFEADNRPRYARDALDTGWSPAEREYFKRSRDRLMTKGGFYENPLHPPLMATYDGRSVVTRCRRQLLDDDTWYRHPCYQDYFRPADNDDTVISVQRRDDRNEAVLLNANRCVGDRPFGTRELLLIDLTTHELTRRIGTRLCTRRHKSMHGLTPRQRQTLERLLAGDSEKQIAQHLGIRPGTVHDHAKALHRHFGVQSRGELMAYFVRREPGCVDSFE